MPADLSFSQLKEANASRQRQWDGEVLFTPLYFSNALAGEAGETCNKIKKLERAKLGLRGSTTTLEAVGEEIADVVVYADLLAQSLGLDLATCVRNKFNATSEEHNFDVRL